MEGVAGSRVEPTLLLVRSTLGATGFRPRGRGGTKAFGIQWSAAI